MILAAVVVAVTPFIVSEPPTDARSILDDIERLDRAINASEETLHGLAHETEQLTSRTTLAEAELVSAHLRYDTVFAVYRDRVRAIAREPAGSLLVLLGESDSLAELLRTTKLLRRVATHDQAVQAKLAAETLALRAAEERADTDRKAIAYVVDRIRETRDTLAVQRRGRIATVQRALLDSDERATMQRELAASKSHLAGMLERTEPTTSTRFSTLHGKLAWPVIGDVKSRFGEVVDRHLGTARDGIVIRATVGDPVQAVARGHVAYAGWMRGYGQMVLIDHGEHYFTVVSSLGHIDVHAGEDVAAGARLGLVGESGLTSSGGLGFELRQQGAPVDPLPWLKR